MVRGPSLHVLAEVADIGLPEMVTVPVRAFDPVLRPFIRKNVRRAVDSASAETSSKRGDHVLRLAFLRCHGGASAAVDPNDERAVAQAFAMLAAPYLPSAPPSEPEVGGAYRVAAAERDQSPFAEPRKRAARRWPITVPAALVALAGALATAAFFLVPRLLPTPAERFRNSAFGVALGEPLSDVVVATNRGGNAEARAKLLAPGVQKQIGKNAYESLVSVVDELPHVRADGEQSIDSALAPLFLEINELDSKLAAAEVPAHVHGYGSRSSGKAVVWLTSYFVEQREELTLDGAPLRFVWGRRLDGLNLADNGLYKARAEEWAVVSMDVIEEEFVQTLLAPIAIGAPLAPDSDASESSARAEMSRTAGRLIAEELVAKTKISSADAAALHHAIAQRNELARSISKIGYRLPATSGIELSAGTVRRVTRAKDDNPREAALFADYLRLNDRAASHRRDVGPAVTALTRLEEEELAGWVFEEIRAEVSVAPKFAEAARGARARAVMATSLAILARPQECPRLALWRLVRPLFDSNSNDEQGASAALGALLVKLGLAKADEQDGDRTMKAIIAALELPPEKVREAASATYHEIVGRPAPVFARRQLR